jgi:hypothetical protein
VPCEGVLVRPGKKADCGMEKFFVGVGAMICGWARGVLGVAWRWFGRILRRLMDSSTVTKPLDISAFDTASLKERLGGLRRYL